jgi:hypothetical protein
MSKRGKRGALRPDRRWQRVDELWSVALLGAIAGLTIFLGLPFVRVRKPSLGLRVFLNGSC